MKKRLILILTLGLSLTGCLGKKVAPEEKKTPPPPKIEESVESVESVEDKKEDVKEVKESKESSTPYKDIYKELEGKEFFMGGEGSYGEAIYFYRDGYFDGMAFTGNGGHENDSLFNGKFDIVEKVDDLTYKIRLAKLDYEDFGKDQELVRYDNFHLLRTFENMSVLDNDNEYLPKEKVDFYTLYLPYTKRDSISEGVLRCFDMSLRNTKGNSEILGRFAISDDNYTTFAETIKEQ
ncbi:MAG: hypothetical protein SOW41_08380 [Anaerococcus sp.]|nr:hypothetical protein [Peptoniphilaceae bacterium]MDY3056053.1 hypothetical protein [Anaerococcus sp.]